MGHRSPVSSERRVFMSTPALDATSIWVIPSSPRRASVTRPAARLPASVGLLMFGTLRNLQERVKPFGRHNQETFVPSAATCRQVTER